MVHSALSPRRVFATLALAALSSIVLASQAFEFSGLDVDIHVKAAADLPKAERWAAAYGRIVSASGTTLRVRLNSPERAKQTLSFLSRQVWAKEPTVIAPEMPLSDVRSMPVSKLDQIVREYKAAYAGYQTLEEREDEGADRGEELDEVPGLDFLEAYLEYKRIRAYPNDEIDFSGYLEVARRRQREAGSMTPRGRNIGSSQWEFVGPTNLNIPYTTYYGQRPINGRVNAIAVSPSDPQTIFLAGSQGGVWKTTDGGVTWMPKGDGFPLMGTSSVAIHPTNPNIVLVGTGDYDGFDTAGIGIMRSTDGGETFVATGAGVTLSSCVKQIVFDPDDPNIVIAVSGKGGSGGIFRSTNAGQTWSTIVSGGNWDSLTVTVPEFTGGPRRYYATSPGNPPRIFTSTNRGASWSAIAVNPLTSNASTTAIAASKVFPNTLYVMSSARVIFKSDNAGATWTSISAGFPNGNNNYNWSQAWYDWHLNTSYRTSGGNPVDVVYIGLIDIVQSRDGGTTWRNMGGANWTATYSSTAITHNDQHSFAVDPSNPNRVYVGNDGGIYRANYTPGATASADTLTYNLLSANLGITQFYTLATHPTNKDYIKGGTQDNATPHSFGDLANWGNPGAGDGAGCVIARTNPNLQYNSSQYQNIYKTTNGYSSRSTITPSWSGHSTPFIGDLWLDPNNDNILYANTNYLNRYTHGPNSWSLKLGNQVLGGRANALAIPVGNSNRLLVGSNDGQFWRSDDQGATWTRIDRQGQANGLPNRAFTSISISPTNANDVIVTLSGTGTPHLYRCTNVAAASPVWTSASGSGVTGLPNVPANSVARDLDNPLTTWYVGTDVGVYMTTDAGATWVDITRSRGLPNVQVTKLQTVPGTRMLNAATFGRGMWRMRLRRAEIVSLVANPNPTVGGASATGTVTIDRPAPTGGYVVNLSENSPLASVPASVTIPAGQNAADFAIETVRTDSGGVVTVTASAEDIQRSVVLQVAPFEDLTMASLNLTYSEIFTGTLPDSFTANNQYLKLKTLSQRGPVILVDTHFTTSLANAADGKLEIEGFVNYSGLTYVAWLQNRQTGQLVQFAGGSLPTTETRLSLALPANLASYVDPGTGRLDVRLAFQAQTRNGDIIVASLDQVLLRLRP